MVNNKVTAYYIDDLYYLLFTQKTKAIYEVGTKRYYRCNELEDLPNHIKNYLEKDNLNKQFTKAIFGRTEEVKLSLIDGNALNNFEKEKDKPFFKFENSSHTKKLIEVKNNIEDYYKIVVNKENLNERYYFSHKTNHYEPLDVFKLGYILSQDFGVDLIEKDVQKLFGLFRNVQEPNNEAIAFNNVVLDTNTFEQLPLDTFTTKRINFNYLPLKDCKRDTLTETTLKSIFIPYNKQGNDKYYNDFLQRVGASFKKVNKHKMIYLLTGSGNDGKSIVLQILRIMHGSLALNCKPKDLVKQFYLINTSNTNVILMDELSNNSFPEEVIEILKLMTGRGSTEDRGIFSEQLHKIENFGVIFIGTNVIPSVKFTHIAYWDRLIIIKLPNKFLEDVDEDDALNNIYKADDDLYFKLENDKDGIEWLISASIEAYKKMHNGFIVKQSAIETQFLFDGENPLRVFINNFIAETNIKSDRVNVKEIIYNLLNWCNTHNITKQELGYETLNELQKAIGYKLRDSIPNLQKGGTKDQSTAYEGLIINIDYDYDNIKYEYKGLTDDFFSN